MARHSELPAEGPVCRKQASPGGHLVQAVQPVAAFAAAQMQAVEPSVRVHS